MIDPLSLLVLGAEGVLIGPMLAGSVLYSQQRYAEAARAFELAARIQPVPMFRATCYINLSACHAEMAQPELTVQACNRAERSSNSRYVRALAHINRAHAYLLLGRMEDSQKEAERAIELSPHWRRGVRYAMVNYADAMGRMGRYPEALQTARLALHGGGSPDPAATSAARREIGMLLVQMGRPREALQEMDQALQLGPQRPDHRGMIYQIMASAWVSLGDVEEAARALDEAERLGVPAINQPVLLQARARICMLQGQIDHAIALLRSAEVAGRTPLVRSVVSAYLATCLAEQGKYGEALARAHDVLVGECQYRHIQAVCHLVEANGHFSLGNMDEGCAALEKLRSFKGMSPILDAASAVAHAHGSFEAERYEDTAEWIRAAREVLGGIEGHPDMRRAASLWFARSLTRLGKADEARDEVRTALSTSGVNHRERADLLHALGESQLAMADRAAARATFEEAVESNPDCARAWFSLGQLLALQGNPEDGAACLRAARAADPEGTWGRDAGLSLSALKKRHPEIE